MIKKYLMCGFLIFIILVSTILLIVYRDKAFTNKIVIDYPDGCKEVYVNAKLVGEPCTKIEENIKWLEINLSLPLQ